jgi:hypothetical protein
LVKSGATEKTLSTGDPVATTHNTFEYISYSKGKVCFYLWQKTYVSVEDKYCNISSCGVQAEDGFTTTVALYVSNFGFLTSLAICVLDAETCSDRGATVFCW